MQRKETKRQSWSEREQSKRIGMLAD